MTDDFADLARLREITTIDIDPGIREAEMRGAFVAMPFGEKTYKRRKVDCDATFAKVIVPVLEDADLAWKREDRSLDAGIIHVGMIEQLGNADIVVVDTITENANVFYELGLRHAFADKTTILLGPVGTSPPFDTRPIRASRRLSAPQPTTVPPSMTDQNVIPGPRSASRSRACLLSGGVTDSISLTCSARNLAICGPVRSSTTICTAFISGLRPRVLHLQAGRGASRRGRR